MKMTKSPNEVKYAWKCLRDLYRNRIKRVIRGELHNGDALLEEPIFKLLHVMCADNMKIGSGRADEAKSLIQQDTETNDVMDANASSFNENEPLEDAEIDTEIVIEVKEELYLANDELPFALAQEVLEHMSKNSPNALSSDSFWNEAEKKLRMNSATAKTLWKVMKKNYLADRADVDSAGLTTRLRLQSNKLFNLMNQIVPVLEELEPSVEDAQNVNDRWVYHFASYHSYLFIFSILTIRFLFT